MQMGTGTIMAQPLVARTIRRTDISIKVMSTTTRTITPIESLSSSGLMQLMWLASPALPVGGFSYSEVLEAAVDQELAHTEALAKAWLVQQLNLSLARGDLAVLAQSVKAWRCADTARVKALNDWVLQTRESAELRAQTEQMGKSMLDWLRNHTTTVDSSIQLLSDWRPTYPVAFALAASGLEAPLKDCVTAYAFAWAENMVQAAIKAVPLGQSAGQRILQALVQAIPEAVNQALNEASQSLTHLQAFSPMLAILSSQHETQYSRLFRS
jgi:urease accessory protein